MPQAQRHAAGQRAWARVRLIRGSSSGALWEISADYPEARLTVGADPSAGWAISAPGVHPVHCELFWDGASLWVADTHQVGGVSLDGQRVTDWVQMHGPCELRFGSAALVVETSRPAHEQMVSRPDQARPVTLADIRLPPERPTEPIFGGAASDDSIPELDGGATRVVSSPILPDGAPAAPPDASPMASLRPRLGGDVAPAAVEHSAEATRMVMMPAAPPARAMPAHPMASAPSAAAPMPPHPGFGASPSGAPAFASPAQPAPSAPAEQAAAAVGQAAAGQASPFGGAFVAPPEVEKPPSKKISFAQILEKLKPESSADVVGEAGAKKGQTIPTRTWIMLGVTLVAAIGLLLWEGEEGAPAAQASAGQATVGQVSAGHASAEQATPPVQPATAAAAEPAEVSPPVVAEPEAVVEAVADEEEDGDAGTRQRQAVDHYVAGRYVEALALYRALARAHPDQQAYATMVQILERRTRCHDGVGPGGEPCGTSRR